MNIYVYSKIIFIFIYTHSYIYISFVRLIAQSRSNHVGAQGPLERKCSPMIGAARSAVTSRHDTTGEDASLQERKHMDNGNVKEN